MLVTAAVQGRSVRLTVSAEASAVRRSQAEGGRYRDHGPPKGGHYKITVRLKADKIMVRLKADTTGLTLVGFAARGR